MDPNETLSGLPAWQKALLQRYRLDPAYLASAQYWFDPLADSLAVHQTGATRPVLIGVNGSQGSGKSTLCAYLEMAIAAKYQLKAVTLSLDDFYLPHADRLLLSQDSHPLFATRGVPGTHDMALLKTTLDALLDEGRGSPVPVPRFDKATDDRSHQPEWVPCPVDIVLLEGWCLGVHPQTADELIEPMNVLERTEDPDVAWRTRVNDILRRDFLPLYQRVDQWIMLQAPSFDCVFKWRLEQEKKLGRAHAVKLGKRVMNEDQLARFIQFFERLTRQGLEQMPSRMNHLFTLDEARQVKAYQQRDEWLE
ncbi:MAG: hypothetical protein V7754_20760 [Halioglobus sp.]